MILFSEFESFELILKIHNSKLELAETLKDVKNYLFDSLNGIIVKKTIYIRHN